MSINLRSARRIVRLYARNAQDSTMYSDEQIDIALQTAADELILKAGILPRMDTFTAATNVYLLPSMPANFRPDRLRRAYLTGSNVQVSAPVPLDPHYADYSRGAYLGGMGQPNTCDLTLASVQNILDWLYSSGGASKGQPQSMAFDQRTATGYLYPIPDQNYTVNLWWNDLFATWPAGSQGTYSSAVTYNNGDVVEVSGTLYQSIQGSNLNHAPASNAAFWQSLGSGTGTDPAAFTFNVVDDYLRGVCQFGAPAKMQWNEPENGYAASAQQKWDTYIQSLVGKGNLGNQEIISRGVAR